jgi:transposase
LISAEYCAHARQRLFEEIGYEVPVLFFQGFAGDQRPNVPERRGLWERIWKAALFGPTFAMFDAASWSAWVGDLSSAIGAAFTAASAQAAVPAAGRIDTALFQLPLSEIIDGEQTVSRSVVFQRISCSNMLELFCVSAEPSTQLRDLIPFQGAVPVGYTGDVFGYWPTEQQRREGGYEGRRFFLNFGLYGRRFRANLDAKFREAAEKLANHIDEWPAAAKRS